MTLFTIFIAIHLFVVCGGVFLRHLIEEDDIIWSWQAISCEAKEFFSCLLLSFLLPGWLPKLPPENRFDESTPIIFVPGYALNRLSFWALQRYLHSCGYTNSWAINHNILRDDITEFSKDLACHINDFSRRNNHQKVVLVAHSMGGIVCNHYLQTYGTEKVAGLITIGTPWFGTIIHRLGFGKHVHQMKPKTALVDTPKQIPVPHLCFYSSQDWVVLPTQNALHPENNSKMIANSGHVSMLFSVQIFHDIRNFINNLQN